MIDFSEISAALGTLSSVLALFGGVGVWLYRKQNKRLKESEAMLSEINVEKAKLDFDKERINHLHQIIENYNKTEIEHSQRISDLNHALNVKEDECRDKTLQIRNLTEKLYTSEQEVNRVQDLLNDTKDELLKRTEERDEERRKKEYYKRWRCEKSYCKDPDGRQPPNSKLATEDYVHPE
ncbi:MAG: hypothetical protein HDS66_06020 [Bacteroidales bacterium]|nr:hypothetical protein [Bacteroidales bacterium]